MPEPIKSSSNLSSPLGGQGAVWIEIIYNLQDKICAALEACDGRAKFIEDKWERDEGGGGKTRVISNGKVFEKGGVNTSVVHGKVTDAMHSQLKINGETWWAAGISIVIHPLNPFVPTIHCNYRMFELYDDNGGVMDRWFGGGTDLTPYYLIEEDAVHFHQTYKNVCDQFDTGFYKEMKETCDNYFVNWHRNNERRGIGGIFYDHKREAPPPKSPGRGLANAQSTPVEDSQNNWDASVSEAGAQVAFPLVRWGWADFGKACGEAFIDAYVP
ncbi:MAG TPA: coproporphyrinogen III oxidase, partial [Flavisolibacter sp.]|nr:coproporphyrinogen III oxidase [Flavisolibacter sp.]